MTRRRPDLLLGLAASLALAAGACLAVAAGAAAQPGSGIVRPSTEPATPSASLGAQLFAGNCASCHGIAGTGVSSPRPGAGFPGEGPPLRHVGALAADFYLRAGYMPLSSIHDQPGPDRVLLSNKEIVSLTAYIAALGSGPGVPHPRPAAGSLSAGMQLFSEHCAGCHQMLARGGFVTGAVVPPLQDVAPTQIAEAVRIGPYEMPSFSTGQISNAQLNSIITYVLSTRHPVNRGGWGIGNIGPIPEGLVTWWIAAPLLILACLAVGRRMRRS
ncbi:MAG TPA: c-type cytochrome [Solirubrobacteraceae bacterium]|jgi:ubiquinol-cytochrome c reductase cytochrome c subunit|nr:c-type cytochrome [Solirubrobacteraceae bacterium]